MRCRMGAISCITALRTVRRDAEPGDSTKASARRLLIIYGHHQAVTIRVPSSSPPRILSRTPSAAPGAMRTCSTPSASALSAASNLACIPPLAAGGGGKQRPNLSGAIEHAFHIGQEDELAGAEGGGTGDRHLICIDVVYPPLAVAGDAGHYRHIAVDGQQMQEGGVGFRDPADGAKRGVHLLGLDEKTIDAGDANSPV